MANLSIEFIQEPSSIGIQFQRTNDPSGSIRGENGSVPMIWIDGPAGLKKLVMIQLVSKDKPYRPHPFALIGKHCENGVYTNYVNDELQVLKLDQMGIQFFTPDENEKALWFRKKNNMDPFGTGFSTRYLVYLDYFTVRLCATVKIIDSEKGEITKTIVSEPINEPLPSNNSCYFRMRTGMRCVIPTTYNYKHGAEKISMFLEREVRDGQTERTNPYSFEDALSLLRRSDETRDVEFLDRIQRMNYNQHQGSNMVLPLPTRRNSDESNLIQSFPNSSISNDRNY